MRRLPAVLCLVGVLVLTGCRIDVTVEVTMEENGSGELTVTVVADPEVVAAAPGLATDVRVDDLVTAGWRTDGATATPDGGLQLVLTRGFRTPEQATALLSSLNGPSGPLQAILIERAASLREVTFSVRGSGSTDGGLDAFTDADLLAAVGGTPYAEQIAAAGATADEVLGVRLQLSLPGEITSTTGTELDLPAGAGEDGDADRSAVEWTVALDGTTTAIEATSTRSLERGGVWPWLANGLLVLLVAWIVVSVVLVLLVARARRRRFRAADRLERFGRL
jgi:hypothetical protein